LSLHEAHEQVYRRTIAINLGPRAAEMVRVVEATQSMLHVAHVPRMLDHPGGVLGRDDEIEVAQIEGPELTVAVDEVPERTLATGELDEFRMVWRQEGDLVPKAPEQAFHAPEGEGNRTRPNDGDLHFTVVGYSAVTGIDTAGWPSMSRSMARSQERLWTR